MLFSTTCICLLLMVQSPITLALPVGEIAFRESVQGSSHLDENEIKRGADMCCSSSPAQHDCCVRQLRLDKPITSCSSAGNEKNNALKLLCPTTEKGGIFDEADVEEISGDDGDKQIAACLERHFYNTSAIEEGAYECCELLSERTCRRRCSTTLLAPSVPLDMKLDIAYHCVPNIEAINASLAKVKASLNRTTFTESEEQDLERIQRCKEEPLHRHGCFSTCLTEMQGAHRRRVEVGAQGTNRTSSLGLFHFDSYEHCPSYREYVDINPCMVLLEKPTDAD